MALPGFVGQNVTVTTGAAALGAATVLVNTGLRIKALTGNTTTIFVSNASDATTGNAYPIYPGQTEPFDVGFFKATSQVQGNLAGVYVLSAAGTQGVAYWGV